MRNQQRNVLAAPAERRHLDVHDVQTIVQVLAELSADHELMQVAVGRGNDAHVDRYRLGAADRTDLILLQHAQQFDLQAHRHVADLIEQQACRRSRSRTGLSASGWRRRRRLSRGRTARTPADSSAMALQLMETNGLLRPGARLVDRAREQFLAGAALAGDAARAHRCRPPCWPARAYLPSADCG